jgi:opacity protein-like surface antigen
MIDKKYIYRILGIIMFILVVFTTNTMAQGLDGIHWKGWGGRAGLSSDPDQGYGGVHVNLGEFARNVRFRPSMELGFGDDQTLLQMLAEVHYVFSNIRIWQPYVGGGLGLTYVNYDNDHNRKDDSDTDLSFNPIGGIETAINKSMKFFFEIKLGLTSNDPDIKFGVGLSLK